jgi:glycosyltransferase involved in cell wall biosynthesis
VASDTAPVRDALEDGVNAKLVPFHDAEALANGIVELLKNPEMAAALGAEARQTAIDHFDLHSMCLPRQLAWVEALANYQ